MMFPKRTVFSVLKENARRERLEEGRESGLTSGLRLGRLEVLEALLDAKFGTLSSSTLASLRGLSDDALHTLPAAITKATSLSELGLGNP